jgi:hypothetical protein
MLLDGFTLGFIATSSVVAAMFFLRFWRRTGDFLFLAFATAFLLQAISSTVNIFTSNPDSVRSWMYVPQVCAYLLILLAILRKNRSAR